MPSQPQASGACANTSQPTNAAKPICAYITGISTAVGARPKASTSIRWPAVPSTPMKSSRPQAEWGAERRAGQLDLAGQQRQRDDQRAGQPGVEVRGEGLSSEASLRVSTWKLGGHRAGDGQQRRPAEQPAAGPDDDQRAGEPPPTSSQRRRDMLVQQRGGEQRHHHRREHGDGGELGHRQVLQAEEAEGGVASSSTPRTAWKRGCALRNPRRRGAGHAPATAAITAACTP